MPDVKIDAGWKTLLADEFEQPYFEALVTFLKAEKSAGKRIYPAGSNIFRAYDTTPIDEIKVVILGQDPYHTPGAAMGLSFSVPRSEPIPPSLRNIYKEIHQTLGHPIPSHGDLRYWAEQGVFLLNAMLTVEHRKAGSHRKAGWQHFTDATIRLISQHSRHTVFMLWGKFAQGKKTLINADEHLILESVHPSPLSASRGWFGSNHFAKANAYLEEHGRDPIDWRVPD